MRQTVFKKFEINMIITILGVLILFYVLRYHSENKIELFLQFLFAIIWLFVAETDYFTYKIPNQAVWGILLLSVGKLVYYGTFFEYILGFLVVSIPLFIIALIVPGSVGGGDIKIMAVSGAFAGPTVIVMAAASGSIMAGIWGLAMMLSKKKNANMVRIAMGPFYGVGLLLALWIINKMK